MIDLHTHTTASDGSLTPTELVNLAKETGLSTLAITDHDTVAGYTEAKLASKKIGLNLVCAVEFNIEVRLGEFHLLGYGMDIEDARFKDLLAQCKKNRETRNEQLCYMFNEKGVEINYNELKQKFTGEIGRPHFAQILKEKKIVKTVQEGFDKYLAFGKPFFLKTKGLEFEETCSVIKQTGGVTILAHPMSLYLSWGKLALKIQELCEKGLDGIEAWNAGTKPRYCERLETLAKDLNILVTAGSDFHGQNKSNHKLGFKSSGEPIQDSYFIEGLYQKLKNRN